MDVKDQVQSVMNNARVCMSSDAWTSVRGQSVVNYLASIHGKSFYIESVTTGSVSHTGEWIFRDLSRVIEENTMEVVGVVTDNTSANKLAWRLLAQKYPDKFFYGQFCLFTFVMSATPYICWRKIYWLLHQRDRPLSETLLTF